ncbi:Transthyretin-like family-containing protein [Strongyloides ratti]|uniref:Transthyretin-like family-containing protein n=1 Tax=Strongyloides ratti TaxID=34506 RepID=A0A090KUN1_STRRB|nr:Transthyretin-like family-containing protein [Strongyloides ratti]CEF61126.1 Transthyretin-like family-containing protein [Strongyloides ratti]
MIISKIFYTIYIFIFLTDFIFKTECLFFKHTVGVSGILRCKFLKSGNFNVLLSNNKNINDNKVLAKTQAKLNNSFFLIASSVSLTKAAFFVKIYHNCFYSKRYCLGVIIKTIPSKYIYNKIGVNNFFSLRNLKLEEERSEFIYCGIKKNRLTV